MGKLARFEDYPPGEYGLPHMGAVIADYRKRAGWTSQEDFAIVCGVDKQTVAYWENQKYLSEMDRRIFLCKVLKISPGLLGLTWHSVLNESQMPSFIKDTQYQLELLEENSYGLYEDILSFARTTPNKYSRDIAYRFSKHQKELEKITAFASSSTRDGWKDLLSRYYQHSAFIANHHAMKDIAIDYANKSIDIATTLESEDLELTGSAYYKRARLHVTHANYDKAKEDIQEALRRTKQARLSLRGSAYLLAAEINALYASQDGKLRSQCRQWQDDAAKLLYKKKSQNDATFVVGFSLYAVHHEKAKTLIRFSLFHTTDEELTNRLKDKYTKANIALLNDAKIALTAAKKHLNLAYTTNVMDCTITEAKLLLTEKEYEESAKAAKSALLCAKVENSSHGINEVGKIHTILNELAPQNPYVCNLGVELGKF